MRRLFKLVGEVTLEGMSAVNKGLTSIDKEAKKAERTIVKFGKNMSAAGADMTKFVTGPIVALGAGMLMLADKTGKYADALFDLKDITGLSTDTLQEMENVARVAGVSFDGLMGTILNLTNQIPEIAKGSGPASDAIKKLGINIYDARGNIRDMNSLFPEMLEKLRSIENVTERNAMAQDLFGRSLTDIAPVLGLTTDQFEAARIEAHELGLVMSEDALTAANEYRISIEKLKAQFVAAGRSIVSQFLPVLQKDILPLVQNRIVPAFQSFAGKIADIAKWFSNLPTPAKETILALTGMVAIVGPILLGLGQLIVITKSLSAAVLLLNGALLANPFVLAAVAIGVFALAITGAVKEYQNLQKEHQKFKVMTAEKAAIDDFTAAFDALIAKMGQYGDRLNDSKAAQELIGDDVAALTEKARALGYVIEGDLNQKIPRLNEVSNALRGTVQDLGKGFVSATKDMAGAAAQQEKNKTLTEEEIKKLGELKQKRVDLERQWTDTLNKQVDDESTALEREYQAAIAQADKLGADKTAIEQYYTNERNRIFNENIDAERERLQEDKEQFEATEQDKRDAIKKTAEESRQAGENLKNTIVEYYNYISGSVRAIFSGMTENNIMNIDRQLNADINALNKTALGEEAYQEKVQTLQEQADKKKLVLQRKAAMQEKMGAIFSIGVSTAQAIMKAWASLPPYVAAIMSGVIGGIAAIQTAVVASRPLPFAKGGLVKGGQGGITGQIGEGREDELIFPLKTGVAKLAEALLDKLRSIELPSFAMPQPQFAMAGAGGGFAAGNGGGMHLHIGTLIADDFGLKELDRRMRGIRIGESQRRGLD